MGIEKSYSYIHDFLQKDNLLISVGGEIKYGGQLLLNLLVKLMTMSLMWNLNEQGELCINNVLAFVQQFLILNSNGMEISYL